MHLIWVPSEVIQSSFFFSLALFFSPSSFRILAISFPISVLISLWRAGLYPIPKRSSRWTKKGASTTAKSVYQYVVLIQRGVVAYRPTNCRVKPELVSQPDRVPRIEQPKKHHAVYQLFSSHCSGMKRPWLSKQTEPFEGDTIAINYGREIKTCGQNETERRLTAATGSRKM